METTRKKNGIFDYVPFYALKKRMDQPARRLRFSARCRAVRKVVEALFNIDQHMRLSRTITRAGLPAEGGFARGMRYRYLRSYYLGGGRAIGERLRVAVNHYETIAREFKPEFLHTCAAYGYVLWQRPSSELDVKITLRLPYVYNFDGDMCLVLGINGRDAYIMTLSFADGLFAAAPESQVVLISGIQGVAGRIEDIRKVTELCHNIAPAHLLLFSAEALAAAIGVSAIVGVGRRQIVDDGASFGGGSLFDYDAFWMPLTGVEEARQFYRVPLPFADKPILSIPAKHRGRARKRRELRDSMRNEIATQANSTLVCDCLQGASRVSATLPSSVV